MQGENISILVKTLNIFLNKSITEIGKMTGLNTNLVSKKTSISTLSSSMFSYINIDPTRLKKDFNWLVKTVSLKENGISKESMSFEKVRFHDVVNEEWSASFLKEKFTKTTFLFVVFQFIGSELYFKGFKIWKMPEETINNELKSFWLLLKRKLEVGVTLTRTKHGQKTITLNDLPSTKDSKIMHIRPKASNALDTTDLPDGQLITKQAYWFNASYVSDILSDLPNLKITSNESNSDTQQLKSDYQQIKQELSNEIYTIEQFIKIFQTRNKNFTQFDVIEEQLETIGFKLLPPFILNQNFNSLDEYFDKQILKQRYFTLPEEDVWKSIYAQRKIRNMENNYSIFKIEDRIYLTINALKDANIEISNIISYREAVENFVPTNHYFTLKSLKNSGFHHPIEEFGFDELFYVSLLKRPGYLKSLNISGQLIFIKTSHTPSISYLIKHILTNIGENTLSVDKFLEYLYNTYNLKYSFEEINDLLKSADSDPYYSDSLCMLFINKEEYLNFIQ